MPIGKKKAGHYRVDNKRKDDRQVLSYEQLPLDQYESQEESPKLDKKKLIVAGAIIVLLFVAVLVYFNFGSITTCIGNNFSDDLFSVPVSGTSVDSGNFRTFSDGLCYTSDTGFVYLDAEGEKIYSQQHGFGTPIMKLSSDLALVYDLDSTGYSIYSSIKQEYSGDAEDKILLADISSDGDYALVTEANGYNAKLTVYSSEHEKRYAYSFSDYYITSMALNSNATKAVVTGLSADEGVRVSAVYILDFEKEEPVAKHLIRSDVLFDCDFLSNKSVCAVGSAGTYIINGSSFSEVTKKSYSQMTLTAYDINTDIGVVALSLSRSGDGRNCNIEYVNSSGKTEKTIETDCAVISVSTYKDRVAVSDTSTAHIYRYNGDLLKSHSVNSDCKQIRLYSTNGLYLLGLSEITGLTL